MATILKLNKSNFCMPLNGAVLSKGQEGKAPRQPDLVVLAGGHDNSNV